jgi:hypothetical protein
VNAVIEYKTESFAFQFGAGLTWYSWIRFWTYIQRIMMYPVLSKMLITSPQDHMQLLLLQQKITRFHAMEMGLPLLRDENTNTFECKQEYTILVWTWVHNAPRRSPPPGPSALPRPWTSPG